MGSDSLRSNIFYIRADANLKIGTGHIMRCIALAQTWQDQGGEVTFISHCESEAIKERITQEGFQLITVENPHPHPDDLSRTLEYLKLHPPIWLVLDGYHFTSEYQKAIRDAGIRLLVIDDMNHLPCYHTDILLNQNIHTADLKYHCDDDTTFLLGTRYVLLRREFLKYRDFKREIPDRAKNILVILGGTDPYNVTLKVIKALKLIKDSEIEVKIVIGPANPHRDILVRALASSYFVLDLFFNPPNMPELMAWADLAISGGGSTSWELAFMGLPSLLILLAENQVELVEQMEVQRAIVNLGWHNSFTERQLCQKAKSLIHDEILRKSMSENVSSFVDGQGASHVTKAMRGKLITLRRATYDDCDLLWQWSNEKETRQASFFQKPISWDKHLQWFKEKLSDTNHVFFIALNGNRSPLGQIRYAIEGSKATVSFSIAPESRNLGYGSGLLRAAAKILFNETGVEEILAFIKAENLISLKAFKNAGFKQTEELSLHGIKSYKFILRKKELT